MLYLFAKHPLEVASLLNLLHNSILYQTWTEVTIKLLMQAILIQSQDMENEAVMEVIGGVTTYRNVLVVVSMVHLKPVLCLDSMTIEVVGKGVMRIKIVTFNSNLIDKLHNYVCRDMSWPAGMSHLEMLTAAITQHSMFTDFQFDNPGVAPAGLAGMAAWIVFELSMLEHAFVCYCFEFYLLKAYELDDMETVKAFFTAFETDEQSVFGDDTTTYGIHCILKAVTDIRYIKAHDPSTRARSGWTLESLTAIFDVPTLGLVTLPEFEDEPPVGIATPVAVSPLVVFTDEQIAAMFNTPSGLPTPRRLMF